MELKLIRQSVGIDIAMSDFKVCYGYMTNNMDQEKIAESTFDNTIKGMQGLLLWLALLWLFIAANVMFFLTSFQITPHVWCLII
jgi:hypothetical protein